MIFMLKKYDLFQKRKQKQNCKQIVYLFQLPQKHQLSFQWILQRVELCFLNRAHAYVCKRIL